MTHLVLQDELLDAQTLRVSGSAAYGGGDLEECLATARRIRGTDLDSWYAEWLATADSVVALGEAAERAGDRDAARYAFLRASNYYRTAGLMLMGTPIDPRLVSSNARQTEIFRRGAALLGLPPETIEIPFEDTPLPGYFFRAAADGTPRATVILLGGYDGTAEELYFFNGAAALARGYNVIAFDGPGQGGALIQRGLTIRAEWEIVVAAVVDYALTRPEVDPDRIALIGLSLGAHLGPRAASTEHRLAALIADCGSYDLYASFLSRLPGPLAGAFERDNRIAVAVVRFLLGRLAKAPTGGWALRRGMLVHGVADPVAYVEATKAFTLRGRAERIACPTWVCNAEGDDVSASAPALFAALTCDKTFVTFTAAEGADDHCEVGARQLYHERSFGWLGRHLHPDPVTAGD
jgi:alpha-beta hydrolase superfamily lysophospholipase